MRIAIIGAGPAGLTVAHQLAKNGLSVDVYDNAAEVGGFAKTVTLWGQPVEIGPHFLNVGYLPVVRNFVTGILNGNFEEYKRKTYIINDDALFEYPPSVGNILSQLSIAQIFRAAASLIRQTIVPVKSDGSAEKFVTRSLGQYLYKLFFANFSKKLWGLDADEVSDVFARSLLGFNAGFSPGQILWHKLESTFSKTADDAYYIYPNKGLSTLWGSMRSSIEDNGGRFFLSTYIQELTSEGTQVTGIRFKDGTTSRYDAVVATIPLAPLLTYLKYQSPAAGLKMRFRSNVLIYLRVTFDTALPAQCFYVYTEKISATRVTNFNEFDKKKDDSFNILLVEFWCDKKDPVWILSDDEVLQKALSALQQTNVFIGLEVLGSLVKKVENAFQIPDIGLTANRDELYQMLDVYDNLHITGRASSVNFNYGMENAIDDALKLSAELLETYNQPEPWTVA